MQDIVAPSRLFYLCNVRKGNNASRRRLDRQVAYLIRIFPQFRRQYDRYVDNLFAAVDLADNLAFVGDLHGIHYLSGFQSPVLQLLRLQANL